MENINIFYERYLIGVFNMQYDTIKMVTYTNSNNTNNLNFYITNNLRLNNLIYAGLTLLVSFS